MPRDAAEVEKMSHVDLNWTQSSRAPPRIGPIIVPIEPAILKAADALSLIYELSYTFSFS
jgi:hypothetical protein